MRLVISLIVILLPLPLASTPDMWRLLWLIPIGMVGITLVFRGNLLLEKSQPDLGSLAWAFVCFSAWLVVNPLVRADDLEIARSVNASFSSYVQRYFFANGSLQILGHFVFFLAVFHLSTTRKHAIRNLVGIGVVISCYTTYGLAIHVYGLNTILFYEKWSGIGALTATFVNRNHTATFIGLGLMSLFVAIVDQLHSKNNFSAKPNYWGSFSNGSPFILFSAVAVLATSLALTGSRGGVASTTLALLAASAVVARIFPTWRQSLLLGVLLVFTIVLLVNSSDLLALRLSFGVESDQRWELYALGLRAFEDNPVTGSGVGYFPQIFKIYRDLNIPSTNFIRAHNDFLELSIASGMIGSVLFGAILFCYLRLVRRVWVHFPEARLFSALAVAIMTQVMSHSLVDFPMQVPAISYLVTALLAIAVSPLKWIISNKRKNGNIDHISI